MKKEKATIYDYAWVCKKHDNCKNCPLGLYNNREGKSCDYLIRTSPNKANEIILKWCKEHPVETRQSKIQKAIPNLALNDNGCIDICPVDIDEDFDKKRLCDNYAECDDCKKEYWLAEVEENE